MSNLTLQQLIISMKIDKVRQEDEIDELEYKVEILEDKVIDLESVIEDLENQLHETRKSITEKNSPKDSAVKKVRC